MTVRTSRSTASVTVAAETIDNSFISMLDRLASWRAGLVAATTLLSTDVSSYMLLLSSVRNSVNTMSAAYGGSVLSNEYRARFPDLAAAYNVSTEWAVADTAIVALWTWLRDNWPAKVNGSSPVQIAFCQLNATTGMQESFTVTLSGANRTTLLARIDAVLAAFN